MIPYIHAMTAFAEIFMSIPVSVRLYVLTLLFLYLGINIVVFLVKILQ